MCLRGIFLKKENFVYVKEHIEKSQERGLMGHFGVEKTLELLKGKFFWPHMRRDIQRHCFRCISCLKSKSKAMPHGFYTPLPFASAPSEDMMEKCFHDLEILFVIGGSTMEDDEQGPPKRCGGLGGAC